ncbi:MAG TPA: hypothetical protein VHE13_01795, partial [Opitutus sp.]|nr:hypothetical protein [Opitutus sp.]
DRDVQLGHEVAAREQEIARLRTFLQQQVDRFNHETAGGKWKHMMPGLETAPDLTQWNSQVRWPWGEKPPASGGTLPVNTQPGRVWRDAAAADRQSHAGAARWTPVAGLGATGRALALLPAGLSSAWRTTDEDAPTLEYDFSAGGTNNGSDGDLLIDFLPTFRIYPGLKQRVAIAVGDQPAMIIEVPGSSGREDENGTIRSDGIQNNYVRASVPLPALPAGRHVLKVRAIDPGVVIDRLSLPAP